MLIVSIEHMNRASRLETSRSTGGAAHVRHRVRKFKHFRGKTSCQLGNRGNTMGRDKNFELKYLDQDQIIFFERHELAPTRRLTAVPAMTTVREMREMSREIEMGTT